MRVMNLLLLAALAGGCGGYGGNSVTAPPTDGSGHQVSAVGTTTWSPSQITIRAGEQVSFSNATGIVHNVQFDQTDGRPANVLDFGSGSKPVTFNTVGTFNYHCGIHPNMQGRVVVEAAATSTYRPLLAKQGSAS